MSSSLKQEMFGATAKEAKEPVVSVRTEASAR